MRRLSRILEKRYRRSGDPGDRLAWVQQERERHRIYRVKESVYWSTCISESSAQPRKLWGVFSKILGADNVAAAPLHRPSAQELMDFFNKKIDDIRNSTGGSEPSTRLPPATSSLDSFRVYAVDEVGRIIWSTKPKSCLLDPVPTLILMEYLDIVLPFITVMCNKSLQEGRLPSSQRHAIVTPILKKSGLDAGNVLNYRPISNLTYCCEPSLTRSRCAVGRSLGRTLKELYRVFDGD